MKAPTVRAVEFAADEAAILEEPIRDTVVGNHGFPVDNGADS